MKKYINTSNYYLSTITTKIPNDQASLTTGTFDVADVTVDGVILPLKGYYWVDVDFGDTSKREIFRIKERVGYTLHYDARISPAGAVVHSAGASVGLRDFSQLLNSLSTNTDNFGEVEQTGDLSVVVRGGTIYHTSNMNAETGKITLPEKTPLTFNTNTTTYIVLQYNEDLGQWAFEKAIDLDLKEAGQYPIAKITTGSTMIDEDDGIIDLRSLVIGLGNMRAEVYDPDGKKLDVYNYENFYNTPVATDWDISDISDRADKRGYWNDKQQQLVSGQNIVTINGKSIIDVSQWEGGNISLDTILTAGWETAKSTDGADTFIFGVDSENIPLTENSFIVFSDSGTMLTEGGSAPNDYTYNNDTHTITFNSSLAFDEHAIIWLMYNNTDSVVGVGSGVITIKWGDGPNDNFHFSVNQDENNTLSVSSFLNNNPITFTQGAGANGDGETLGTITTNQSEPSTINVKGNISVTQNEYNNLPESKTTDGNRYFIYEE